MSGEQLNCLPITSYCSLMSSLREIIILHIIRGGINNGRG